MPTSFTLNASWIIIGIIVILVVILYNRLVRLKNNRENAFADIDVQLKLRFDLVENLVNTVKGYATHEQETFQKVIEARNSFAHAGSVDSKIAADNQLTGALKSIFPSFIICVLVVSFELSKLLKVKATCLFTSLAPFPLASPIIVPLLYTLV